jgi:hypothetical protein
MLVHIPDSDSVVMLFEPLLSTEKVTQKMGFLYTKVKIHIVVIVN